MKLFVSYRRNDTGGRAGRLVDALVAEFGARNVFQDVDAMSPGHSFRDQIEAAITTSDALLIVIGPDWLGIDGAAGGRRIDSDDDFVRLEVVMALSLGIPVVPVLVGGATLPTRAELPADMSQMLDRHAVSIRDISWHQDVDDFARRLKGEARPATGTSRRPIVMAVGLAVLVAALLVAAAVRSGSEGSEGSEGSSEALPECNPSEGTWAPVELAGDSPIAVPDNDGNALTYAVQAARVGGPDNDQVVIEVTAQNDTDDRPGDDTDNHYFYEADIDELLVNSVAHDVFCFGPVVGDQSLEPGEPGERATASIGFRTTEDLTGAELILKLSPSGRINVGTAP